MSQHTNCEDILLNFVAAAAIRELPTAGAAAAAGEDPPSRWPPYVLWVQPSRRLDISLLSGVGLSRGRAAHEGGSTSSLLLGEGWFGVGWGLSGAGPVSAYLPA